MRAGKLQWEQLWGIGLCGAALGREQAGDGRGRGRKVRAGAPDQVFRREEGAGAAVEEAERFEGDQVTEAGTLAGVGFWGGLDGWDWHR